MPRKSKSVAPPPPRKRRTADEARVAILDAAERLLVEAGPAGIRLQEVAADVGVSHPTVLHHFGSREGLVEAVVARALDSLHEGLIAAVRDAPPGADKVAALLDNVFDTLKSGGHARAFFWLALSGYAPAFDELRIRTLAEAIHEIRRQRHKGTKRMPPFEDTYFTVLLPALSLMAMAVIDQPRTGQSAHDASGPARFRAWMARLIHDHLEDE